MTVDFTAQTCELAVGQGEQAAMQARKANTPSLTARKVIKFAPSYRRTSSTSFYSAYTHHLEVMI